MLGRSIVELWIPDAWEINCGALDTRYYGCHVESYIIFVVLSCFEVN